jgi:hypothetical protein
MRAIEILLLVMLFFQRGAIDSEIAWIRARGVKLKGYDNRYFAVSSGLAR